MRQERETKRGTGLPAVGAVVSNGVAPIPINRHLGDPNHNFKASGPLVQAWADQPGLPRLVRICGTVNA